MSQLQKPGIPRRRRSRLFSVDFSLIIFMLLWEKTGFFLTEGELSSILFGQEGRLVMPTYTGAVHAFMHGRAPMDLSEGAILIDAWLDRYGRSLLDTPEKHLLFEMLLEAIRDIASKNPQRNPARAQAEHWVGDRARDDLFSFNRVWTLFFPFGISRRRAA